MLDNVIKHFKVKYPIQKMYIPLGTKRRSGRKIDKVQFLVAHDTGNKNSTAKGNALYYTNSANDMSASAHIFIDDRNIIETIPALTAPPEKAWHVQYQKTKDNELFGFDANDAAIGVEYCFGDNINADEAYKKYVWVLAYLCFVFDLDPMISIVGHMILDPERKTDPKNGLSYSGRTYQQLLVDIQKEFEECLILVTDIPSDYWAKQSIERMIKNEIMSGFEDNTFKPDNFITRAELASVIDRAMTKISNMYEL